MCGSGLFRTAPPRPRQRGATERGETMRGRKLLAIAGAISALSLGAVACGDDEEGDTGGGGEDVSAASFDLQVGALIPLTGDLSIFAPAGQKAAELAIEEANAALEEAGAD